MNFPVIFYIGKIAFRLIILLQEYLNKNNSTYVPSGNWPNYDIGRYGWPMDFGALIFVLIASEDSHTRTIMVAT